MRVVLLNWKDPASSSAGGAELYVRRVAELWAETGHDVSLFVPRDEGRPREELIAGVRYVRSGNRQTVFSRARGYLRECGSAFDHVVESVSTRPFFAHTVVGGRATALYHQVADDVWCQEYRFPLSRIGRHVVEPYWIRRMRNARVIAVSQSTAADLRRFGVNSIGIVPPGCFAESGTGDSARPLRATPASSPSITFVGRLVRTKRPNDALFAFSEVRRSFPSATLDVIGNGYLLGPLKEKRLPGVTVHGHLPEHVKQRRLASSDLMLLPGTREGWGIVAMEAALQGVPVVAYNIPGFRDAVLDGVTGILTEPNPDALASAAIQLLRDPDRWATYSRAAQERAQRLTWARSAASLMSLIDAQATRVEAIVPAAAV